MFKPSTPSESLKGKSSFQRRGSNFTPKNRLSLCETPSMIEAMNIFNQVQANRQRIFKKNTDNTFYTKTTVKTRKFDAQGKEIIEKFEATAVGGFNNEGEKVGEVVQQYCNNDTGIEKSSVQRVFGKKLRRIEVKRSFDFEVTNEYLENADGSFDREWKEKANNLGLRKVVGFESKAKALNPFRNL